MAAASAQSISVAEGVVEKEVPENRRDEILQYLKLFGYKPESTIIQVHVTGFFNRKGTTKREAEKRQAASKRYGGTTFVVVGRTHDPSIIEQAIKPKNAKDASPGYMGYLWMGKDPQGRAPHEVIPLDFVPAHVPYPKDWKDMFATKGLLLAMHVPSSFAGKKGALTRALYRLGKGADAKQSWDFMSEVKSLGYQE